MMIIPFGEKGYIFGL